MRSGSACVINVLVCPEIGLNLSRRNALPLPSLRFISKAPFRLVVTSSASERSHQPPGNPNINHD